jgi:hypothetical protein
VLLAAEASLRRLIEERLKQQRYGEVAKIAQLADGLAHLTKARPGEQRAEVTDQPAGSSRARPMRSTAATKGGAAQRSPRKFPRFERDGGRLIKVGWSKKRKGEYEHRAPREAVVAFTRHLASQVKPGQVFAIEELLPVPDVSTGGEVPGYQVYLTLAWLREAGAVERKGRDGYICRDGAVSEARLDALWEQLPVRPS